MKHGVISFSSVFILTLLAAPVAAWADTKPDFDDDAKPILRMQPGLLEYVESRFDVKDTGTAKYPGDDDRRPGPPFIFNARPLGSRGPYNLRLLIQPGPQGRILGVVDITKTHVTAPASSSSQPGVANQPPSQPQPAPQAPAPASASTPAPSAPAAAPSPSEPTADTPSGPIVDSGSQAPPSSAQPSLAPPADPAPATH
jgi:hypothetical protein